jgi:hypothetical protein
MLYFFQIDGETLDEDLYIKRVAQLQFCLKKLGYMDTKKGY